MPHARQQIRDSVRDLLSNDPRLSDWRGPFTNRAEFLRCADHTTRAFQPAIRINTPDEQMDPRVLGGKNVRGLALAIELVHRQRDTADDAVDDMAVIVEQLLHSWSLAGVTRCDLISTALDVEDEAETETVSLVLTYNIDYRTVVGDPSVLAN